MSNRIIFAIFLLSAAASYGMDEKWQKITSELRDVQKEEPILSLINKLRSNYEKDKEKNYECLFALMDLANVAHQLDSGEPIKKNKIIFAGSQEKLAPILDKNHTIKKNLHNGLIAIHQKYIIETGKKRSSILEKNN